MLNGGHASALLTASSLRAKRSNPFRGEESMDCFVASAPRNDGWSVQLWQIRHDGRARCSLLTRRSPPSDEGGWRSRAKSLLIFRIVSSPGSKNISLHISGNQ